MATYVLVHGAWHSGDLLEDVASHIRAEGHEVHLPTLAGNRPGDPKNTGLEDAIASLVDFVSERGLTDFVLVGHSYGGMVITGAADRLPAGTIRRLVYWTAFVPNDGESLSDVSPAGVGEWYESIAQPDGSLDMNYENWRELLINDADEELAREAFAKLNPQPYGTFRDKIKLSTNPAEMPMGRSYIHCQEDMAYPHSAGGWYGAFSAKLGLHRFVSMPGGHEGLFTNPALSAAKIIAAGRD